MATALIPAWIDQAADRDAEPIGERFPPVLQRTWELATLFLLYMERRPGRVLEIGTYHGGTLVHWLQFGRTGAVVVSVDSYATGVDNRHLYESWCREGVACIALAGDSRDAAIIEQAKAHGPYDFIFLDAGHAEHEVQADWDNYAPLVAPGGIIALHDILPGRGPQAWIQVAPVWQRIQRQGYVTQELVASVDVDWGGIGVVYL